jgi:hypothetical protein
MSLMFRRSEVSKIRRAFEEILSKPDPGPAVSEIEVAYLLIWAEREPTRTIAEQFDEIASVVRSENGTVLTSLPPLIVATTNLIGANDTTFRERAAQIRIKLRPHMHHLRIVYGQIRAPFGVLDFGMVGLIGILFPDLEARLRKLLDAKAGESIELN